MQLDRDLGILMQFMTYKWVFMAILEQKILDLATTPKFFVQGGQVKMVQK